MVFPGNVKQRGKFTFEARRSGVLVTKGEFDNGLNAIASAELGGGVGQGNGQRDGRDERIADCHYVCVDWAEDGGCLGWWEHSSERNVVDHQG